MGTTTSSLASTQETTAARTSRPVITATGRSQMVGSSSMSHPLVGSCLRPPEPGHPDRYLRTALLCPSPGRTFSRGKDLLFPGNARNAVRGDKKKRRRDRRPAVPSCPLSPRFGHYPDRQSLTLPVDRGCGRRYHTGTFLFPFRNARCPALASDGSVTGLFAPPKSSNGLVTAALSEERSASVLAGGNRRQCGCRRGGRCSWTLCGVGVVQVVGSCLSETCRAPSNSCLVVTFFGGITAIGRRGARGCNHPANQKRSGVGGPPNATNCSRLPAGGPAEITAWPKTPSR
jgi:hypothetical protein